MDFCPEFLASSADPNPALTTAGIWRGNQSLGGDSGFLLSLSLCLPNKKIQGKAWEPALGHSRSCIACGSSIPVWRVPLIPDCVSSHCAVLWGINQQMESLSLSLSFSLLSPSLLLLFISPCCSAFKWMKINNS